MVWCAVGELSLLRNLCAPLLSFVLCHSSATIKYGVDFGFANDHNSLYQFLCTSVYLALQMHYAHTYVHLAATVTKNVNAFALSSKNPGSTRHSHVLQASSEYDKKLWMDAFQSVLPGACKTTSTVESVV